MIFLDTLGLKMHLNRKDITASFKSDFNIKENSLFFLLKKGKMAKNATINNF